MPRKSKEFLRRSAAAKKGWQTRERKARERSERAKRGWETRRKNEHKEREVTPAPGPKRKRIQADFFEDEYEDIIGIDSLYGE